LCDMSAEITVRFISPRRWRSTYEANMILLDRLIL
jgi:hypothetical protein